MQLNPAQHSVFVSIKQAVAWCDGIQCAMRVSHALALTSTVFVFAQLWPGQEAGDTDTELPPEEQQRLGRKRKVL